MNNDIISFIKLIVSFLPFVLFAILNGKANTKKEVRNRQYPMPAFALVYSIVLLVLLDKVSDLLRALLLKAADWINKIPLLGSIIANLIKDAYNTWGVYLSLILFNTAAMLVFIIVKRIITAILAKIEVGPESWVGKVMDLFYTYDEEDNAWYIKSHYGQARTFIKTVYYGSCFASGLAMLISCSLCMDNRISAPFYPVFAIMIIGEVAFFIDGIRKEEKEADMSVEADRSARIAMYPKLRQPLKALFGDKLSAEGTTVNNGLAAGGAIEDVLVNLEKEGGHIGKNYAAFMRRKMELGLKPNVDYVRSGYDLSVGKSLLFNTPFYDKLNPYVFYAMNRKMLTGGKVMIVLGRHGTEEDLYRWVEKGLRQISNVPDLWKIAVLDGKKQDEDQLPDVGIMSRSGVHDLDIHKNNLAFLRQVSFVLLVEPSRLVTTAQIGLNLLIKNCGTENDITFCSVDRNCDGLVDALSHILMTNITEVSATEYPHGMSSYMYWTADDDYLQHRIVPGVSRFLGMGTELSMVALRNQVKQAVWYGGDAFPVKDAHWIAKQYYHDLLDYAQLPTNQETFDKYFKTSFNMCDERVNDYSFISVEDDRNNLFETRRNFATIAEQQGFVNVISSEYMLREYMSANTELFTADAKAIPYITADYARSKRNTILTLCLQMCVGTVPEDVLARQMVMLNIDTTDPAAEIWKEVCLIFGSQGAAEFDKQGNQVLHYVDSKGKSLAFKKTETILYKRAYNVDSGKFESVYAIEDKAFAQIILCDLQNAMYIAEQENRDVYIGTELKGHVYQKYLPGQFFTLSGKYYEMVSTAIDNRIMVRRASDHINGRLSYRQVRNYTIHGLSDARSMGALKTVNNIDIHYQYGDFSVETPGYWKLRAHNDFDNGDLVHVNGVPTRNYHHKQLLKFDFSKLGDAFTDEVRYTLTNLLNEVFVTLFADNQPFISAITPGQFEAPLTYSLQLDEGVEASDKCIFIVEDSQLDIGLLIAVERNVNRIFQIISDYLSWNQEMIDESLRPPEEPAEEAPQAFDVYEDTEPKKKGFFGRIGDWFKGLFGKKKKKEKAKGELPEVPEQEYMMIYGKPHKFVKGKWKRCSQKEFDKMMKARHDAIAERAEAEKAEKEAEKAAEAENTTEEGQEATEAETTEATEETAETSEETPTEEASEEVTEETPAEEAPAKKLGWFARMRAAGAERKAAKQAAKEAKKAEKEAKKAEKAAEKAAEEEISQQDDAPAEAPAAEALTATEEAVTEQTPAEEAPAEEASPEEAPAEEAAEPAPAAEGEVSEDV